MVCGYLSSLQRIPMTTLEEILLLASRSYASDCYRTLGFSKFHFSIPVPPTDSSAAKLVRIRLQGQSTGTTRCMSPCQVTNGLRAGSSNRCHKGKSGQLSMFGYNRCIPLGSVWVWMVFHQSLPDPFSKQTVHDSGPSIARVCGLFGSAI